MPRRCVDHQEMEGVPGGTALPGKCNIVPDTLSHIHTRQEEDTLTTYQVARSVVEDLSVDWAELTKEQEVDDTFQPFKWVELFPIYAPQIARLINEVFTRWGAPAYLVFDWGAQFTSHLLHTTCQQWGVVQKLTTAFHPQTNLTEQVNRALKTMISSHVRNKHSLWEQWLLEFRFAINTTWQESTGSTPADVALGRKLKGPLERLLSQPPDPEQVAYELIQRPQDLLQQVRVNVEKAQNKQARYYNRCRKTETFEEGDLVWVRSHPLSRADSGFAAKLAEKCKGPAKIIKQLNPINYQISYLSNPSQVNIIHIEHLKQYYGQVGSTPEGRGM
ncbi:hypothetical protein SRHO_G00230900 [Serrasalmus rhombeus]